jgi:hypothetical protein
MRCIYNSVHLQSYFLFRRCFSNKFKPKALHNIFCLSEYNFTSLGHSLERQFLSLYFLSILFLNFMFFVVVIVAIYVEIRN